MASPLFVHYGLPQRIVKGSAKRGPGGQAESPASRVVPLDGPVISILLMQTHQYGEGFDRIYGAIENGAASMAESLT